jgi:hypothetical protein
MERRRRKGGNLSGWGMGPEWGLQGSAKLRRLLFPLSSRADVSWLWVQSVQGTCVRRTVYSFSKCTE